VGKLGSEIADMVGPPDSKAKKYPKDSADDGEEGSDSEEAGESSDDEAAEQSAAEEFQSAVKDGSPTDVVEAFKKLMDICG
jgi:hypothetical protein